MAITSQYRAGLASVLRAGQALESAVQIGDEVEIAEALAELRRVAEARELGGGAVAGFAQTATLTGPQEPLETDESLAQVLAELNVGQTLLVAGSVAGERDAAPVPVPVQLPDALDGLKEAGQRMAEDLAEASAAGFRWRKPALPDAAPETFRDVLPQTVDAIVSRTAELGKDVVTGLATIPLSAVQPVLARTVGTMPAIPIAGPLMKAGLRAIRRALQALERLVPAEFIGKLREWAKEWWEQHAEPALEGVAGRLLGVAKTRETVSEVLARTDLADDRLRAGRDNLVELDNQHGRSIGIIQKIVLILGNLVGPLAALFAVAAAWIYGIGAAGLLLALGAGIWIGRDYLDTGALINVVRGVGVILGEVTG